MKIIERAWKKYYKERELAWNRNDDTDGIYYPTDKAWNDSYDNLIKIYTEKYGDNWLEVMESHRLLFQRKQQ